MIGVFDSGSGGLTVLKEIVKLRPDLDVIYFGDLRNVPYGSKNPEELQTLTANAIRTVKVHGAEGIVSACNSLSKTILDTLSDELSVNRLHIIEMVNPTIQYLKMENTTSAFIAATKATCNAGIYQDAGERAGITIYAYALESLAESIEKNVAQQEIERIIEPCVDEVIKQNINTLILGCTQFPLVQKVFQNMFDQKDYSVTIVNPAIPVAEKVRDEFIEEEEGTLTFLISQDSLFFKEKVKEFFPKYRTNIHIINAVK